MRFPSSCASGLSAIWLVATLLCRRPCVTQGQIYTFEREKVPANRSLHTLYAFYVYSYEEAPEKQEGQPFVKFKQLHLEEAVASRPPASDAILQYEGIQLSMMRYRDFWNLIDPQKFCSTQTDVDVGRADKKDQLLVTKSNHRMSYKDVNVYVHTVRFGSYRDEKADLAKTGVYILVFSNCGGFMDAAVSGTVIVKNAYGFLPGNEYHKMTFYGWLLVIYVGLALAWMVLSIRWWRELFAIQNCIAVVIFLGLLECILWFTFFNDWNQSGVRGKFLFVFAILLTVVKSTFSYMLVLVASLGWGITRPYLDIQVLLKIQVLSFLYIVLDFIREAVLSFRQSHSLSIAFVLLCLLPVSLLNGAIFSWVFTALSGLMETLKERRQFEKLALFQRLWKILIAALVGATLTLLFQIFNLSRSITARWKYQWLLTDGISHVLFLFVLASMMYLWAPHKYSQRYAFSHQIGSVDTEDRDHRPGAIWADEDAIDDEGEDAESFWATTKGSNALGDESIHPTNAKAQVDVIGASARERS